MVIFISNHWPAVLSPSHLKASIHTLAPNHHLLCVKASIHTLAPNYHLLCAKASIHNLAPNHHLRCIKASIQNPALNYHLLCVLYPQRKTISCTCTIFSFSDWLQRNSVRERDRQTARHRERERECVHLLKYSTIVIHRTHSFIPLK